MKTKTAARWPRRVAVTVVVAACVLASLWGCYRLSSSRQFQLFGGLTASVHTEEKVVALTFDDGPTSFGTPRILAVLDELDVRATFFVTGADLERDLSLGRQIVASGHELGNHTYSHPRMILKPLGFIDREITTTDQWIRAAGYEGEIHFRPPGTKKLILLPYYLRRQGRRTITWNIEPDTYPAIASDPDRIVSHVIENVTPGSIILLHVMYESRQASLDAVENIIHQLRAEGYSFVTVSELLRSAND